MSKQFIVILTLMYGACASTDDTQLGEATQDGISFNGISFNGISFNGISFNGTSLSGQSLTGVSVNGRSASGARLTAGSSSGPPLSGGNLVGSTWSGTATDGSALNLRIDSAAAGTAPNADLWFYAVSYQTSTGWSPLCGSDATTGAPIQAVAVAGVWTATASDATSYGASSSQFTLACRGATIGKCVELGYKTFNGLTNQLLSCVRLLRGDFCGTGDAYTVSGTLLNLYDNVGVQLDTESWPAEAEWTPTGASCVNKNNDARYQLVLSKQPKCIKRVETATCGTNFANGAVLIDELSPEAQASIQAAQTN